MGTGTGLNDKKRRIDIIGREIERRNKIRLLVED